MKGMQYTIRGIPEEVDAALRKEAASTGKSLNALVIEKLSEDSVKKNASVNTDFREFVGTWIEDPAFDEAMKDFDRIDPEDWQ
ncbi:hypothetical protein OVA24_15510 [Luteolibacter sp. SL250]|uniref:FitA-like ribbon-helix-helix domain-containing protein n=1 Tax=Luteolibacter sp. SL250 TaxID=2995170 RepID=UPI0022704ABE|nr:hypothetical protein [Luteolibacter sp. SL250]MBX3743065.1 hypothetical protein [Akkermansiaceae bacterium]WAC18639.1 hypothetical protein OVA24_15510 [Luteolibacter sp. SL250]